jgi:hypothetical protein
MCVNYKPKSKEVVSALTGADISYTPDWAEEVWQDYAAPVVRAGQEGEPELIVATYGMVPRGRAQDGEDAALLLAVVGADQREISAADIGMFAGKKQPESPCLCGRKRFYFRFAENRKSF